MCASCYVSVFVALRQITSMELWPKSFLALQVATMGTRRKLSVSVNNCGICGGVLKVSDQIHASFMLARQQPSRSQALPYLYLWITSFIAQVFQHVFCSYHSSTLRN